MKFNLTTKKIIANNKNDDKWNCGEEVFYD